MHEEKDVATSWHTSFSCVETQTLTKLGAEIFRAVEDVPAIEAAYCTPAEDGGAQVYAVVREHDPEVYEDILRVENALSARLPGIKIEVHVRARQSRPARDAVPFGLDAVFVR